MKKALISLAFSLILSFTHSLIGYAQSGTFSGDGLYVPRLTTAQRAALAAPTNGQMIYNTDDNCFNVYQNDYWRKLCGLDVSMSETWTRKANFGGVGRFRAVGFSIGNKGYVGTGNDFKNNTKRNDFWEFDPNSNSWTQKANFGGTAREEVVGFSIGNKGYIGTGKDDLGYTNDFWEYNPSANSWTQKANFGGVGRDQSVGFSIDNKGYIGTGGRIDSYYIRLNDFWEYDPASTANGNDANGNPKGNWTQKANFGGENRANAVGFSIGNKGYIGTGLNASFSNLKDFWEYNPSTNLWVQKANIDITGRYAAVGFSIGNKGFIGSGAGSTNNNFWEYDATSTANGNDANGNPNGNWTQKANFGGVTKYSAVGFSIGNKGFMGLGLGNNTTEQDFWEYDLTFTNLTSQGNIFNGANQLVKLDNSGNFPSQVTTQGNALNGANQLVKLNSYAAISLGATQAQYPINIKAGVPSGGYHDVLCIENNSNVPRWHINLVNGNDLNFAESGVANFALFLKKGGNIGIGTNTPTQRLDVAGNVKGTSFINSSDIRFKKGFSKIEKPLDKLLSINGLYYHWRKEEFPNRGFDDAKQVGFIAQDLEKIFPEVVFTDALGFKSVDYPKLTPLLVEAIKELVIKNQQLESRLEKIETLLLQTQNGK